MCIWNKLKKDRVFTILLLGELLMVLLLLAKASAGKPSLQTFHGEVFFDNVRELETVSEDGDELVIEGMPSKQQADLEGLQQRLGAEFQGETEKFNKALRDSIQHFLAVYNKDKKYSLILTKQGDNILYGDKALDITTQVVAGLNKAYKKTDLSKASSKDEKKK